MAVLPCPKEAVAVGESLLVVVPSPSPPLPLEPQHLIDPSLSRAHVEAVPVSICETEPFAKTDVPSHFGLMASLSVEG